MSRLDALRAITGISRNRRGEVILKQAIHPTPISDRARRNAKRIQRELFSSRPLQERAIGGLTASKTRGWR
jgi:hypothetical protein